MLMSNKMLLASSFMISPGDADPANGGYRAYNNFGDGLLYNLNLAAKSTESSVPWGGSSPENSTLIGTLSRLNGPTNTNTPTPSGTGARNNSETLVFGGQTDWYLGAIDELRAISAKLNPTSATYAVFQTGGSEVFTNASSTWSSTELTASNAADVLMTSGSESSTAKTASRLVRPIRRFVTDMPFPIGTAMEGGYLAAYFTDLSSGVPLTYMLIVADKATEVTRAYQTSASSLGGIYLSRTNGSAPTEANAGNTNTAAMNYCFALTSGSKTDWYLPAIDELAAIARLNASLPSVQQLSSGAHWSSSETSGTTSSAFTPSTLTESTVRGKTNVIIVRAVRRVLLP